VARQVRARAPKSVLVVGTGFSYLQEYLPHVAQYVVREAGRNLIGLGRMVLSYPGFWPMRLHELWPQVYLPHLQRLHDAPRNGMISGVTHSTSTTAPSLSSRVEGIKKAVGA